MQSVDTSGLAFALPFYLIVVNAIAFGLFGWDKRAAENGTWRISESTLLLAAAFGGSAGAVLGQSRFRHKTQKQPFGVMLHGIVVLQVLLVLLLVSRKLQIA